MANATKRWLFIALVVLQTVIFGFGNVLTKIAYSDHHAAVVPCAAL